MSLLKRKNKLGLFIACVLAIIFEVLILYFYWNDCPKILKVILIADILYSIVIFVGNIITSIQDKQIEKEIRKLCEHND